MLRLLIHPDNVGDAYLETSAAIYPHSFEQLQDNFKQAGFDQTFFEEYTDQNSAPAASTLEEILARGYEYRNILLLKQSVLAQDAI